MHLLNVYKEVIDKWQLFRHDVLGGGAILEDLLVGEATFYRMAEQTLLAYKSKGYIHSQGYTISEDTGVGLELEMIRMLSELSDKMLFGDGVCPYHSLESGECNAEPRPLCNSIKEIHARADFSQQCIRETVLLHLLSAIGSNDFEWIE